MLYRRLLFASEVKIRNDINGCICILWAHLWPNRHWICGLCVVFLRHFDIDFIRLVNIDHLQYKRIKRGKMSVNYEFTRFVKCLIIVSLALKCSNPVEKLKHIFKRKREIKMRKKSSHAHKKYDEMIITRTSGYAWNNAFCLIAYQMLLCGVVVIVECCFFSFIFARLFFFYLIRSLISFGRKIFP